MGKEFDEFRNIDYELKNGKGFAREYFLIIKHEYCHLKDIIQMKKETKKVKNIIWMGIQNMKEIIQMEKEMEKVKNINLEMFYLKKNL